jgi:hypothetical protein
MVAQVAPGGPGDRAGIRAGDVIVAINGTSINRAATLAAIAGSMAPNSTAHLTVVRRQGPAHQIALVLGEAPSRGPSPAGVPDSAPAGRGVPAIPTSRPAVPTGMKFNRFVDPQEHAFYVDVPAGWRTEGGMARLGMIGVNPHLRSMSPDGMIYLLFGESTLPSFAPPGPLSRMRGVGEGFVYDAGLGQRVMIMHYMSGSEFARSYGQYALSNLCGNLKLVSTTDLPDLARSTQAVDRLVMPTRYTAGEATFSCSHKGQEMQATIQAVTWTTTDAVMWSVARLGGFIATKARAAEVGNLVAYMASTWKADERWIQFQSQLSRQAGDAIQARIRQYERQQVAFNQKMNAMDKSFTDMDEIITGYSTYHDSRTGNDYSLNNLTPNKWIDDATGRIVGTQTNVPPPFAYGLRPLARR